MVQNIFRCGCMAFCLFLFTGTCWGKDVGQVISHKAGLLAERGGQNVPLALKSPVADADTLITDATGTAQILFDDDSTVTLGANTRLRLDTVVAEGKAPVFKAHMGQGMARFITGKIVEKNPEGFAVVTPEATVGIRGTIFVVQVGNGQTTVYVLNTTKQVHVNGILVPASFKITLPHGSPAPMTPEDMDRVNTNLAAREPDPQAKPLVASLAAPAPAGTSLAEAPLNAQALADTLKPQPGTAYVAGTLAGVDNGAFHFTVDLGSGAVSNGVMSSVLWTLKGGNGSIVGANLFVGGFKDALNSGIMSGNATTGANGLKVDGTYEVIGVAPANGLFTGQQQ